MASSTPSERDRTLSAPDYQLEVQRVSAETRFFEFNFSNGNRNTVYFYHKKSAKRKISELDMVFSDSWQVRSSAIGSPNVLLVIYSFCSVKGTEYVGEQRLFLPRGANCL